MRPVIGIPWLLETLKYSKNFRVDFSCCQLQSHRGDRPRARADSILRGARGATTRRKLSGKLSGNCDGPGGGDRGHRRWPNRGEAGQPRVTLRMTRSGDRRGNRPEQCFFGKGSVKSVRLGLAVDSVCGGAGVENGPRRPAHRVNTPRSRHEAARKPVARHEATRAARGTKGVQRSASESRRRSRL